MRMAEDRDVPLPSVPDAESARAYISIAEPDEIITDLGDHLFGPDEISLKSLLLGPATVPASVAGYAVFGDKGTAKVEQEVRDWKRDLDGAKISKYDAYYLPETPIPYGVWEYRCRTCRFYTPPEETEDGQARCEVVGQEGDMFGGERIHPSGWCSLWLPEDGEAWFDYVTERLESTQD